MRAMLTIIGMLLIFVSCKNESKKPILPELLQSDSIEFHSVHDARVPETDSVGMIVQKKMIDSLVHFINSESITSEKECIHDGKLYFFKNGEVFKTIYFFLGSQGCTNFGYVVNGKKFYTSISSEAVEYIKAIQARVEQKNHIRISE